MKPLNRFKEGDCFKTKLELNPKISNIINAKISRFRRPNCLVTYLGTAPGENLIWCRNINHEEVTIYGISEIIDI